MRVPKPKDRCVKKVNLRNLDGVRDVTIGSASVEDRQRGNFKKTGAPAEVSETDDEKARRERYGFPL